MGSVTLTYDPMGGDINGQTTNITLNSLNISIAGTVIAFSYVSASDELRLGGLLNGVLGLAAFTNDFALRILTISTTPTFRDIGVTTASLEMFFDSPIGTVNVVTVPEPPALALFSVGLAMLVFLRLRRRWSLAFRDSVAWIVGS